MAIDWGTVQFVVTLILAFVAYWFRDWKGRQEAKLAEHERTIIDLRIAMAKTITQTDFEEFKRDFKREIREVIQGAVGRPDNE